MATDPVELLSEIADDRLSWELRWRIAPIPLDVWGLIFGDAMHNLRSALDNLLSYIARAEDATPRQLAVVQFPIVTDRAEWSESSRRVSMLPQRVREAIEAVQPFNREGSKIPPSADPLALISTFNNADKHRLAIMSTIRPQEFGHEFSVEFEESVTVDGPPRTTVSADFFNGAIALHHETAPDRIVHVEGKLEFRVQVVVIDEAEVERGITQSISDLLTYLPQVLDYIIAAWQGPKTRET